MKLRIKGNSIRLRLLRGEVAAFSERGFISEEVSFASKKLYYDIVSSGDVAEIEAKYEGDRITIVLPQAIAENWTAGDETGIEAVCGDISVLIEKDLICIGRPDDPDNADAYAAV